MLDVPRIMVEPAADAWTLIALVPFDGKEPPAAAGDELAAAVWCAVSALWHPSLLARAAGLPRIESIDSPSPPGVGRSIVSSPAGRRTSYLPATERRPRMLGPRLMDSGTDLDDLIRQIQIRLGGNGAVESIESEGMTSAARDFLALGTTQWLLRELTVAMGHVDALDHESLTRELLAGAHAWQIGDWASACRSVGCVPPLRC